MSRQWGHGFYKGAEEGHEEGYNRGLSVPDFMLSEQINYLLGELHKHMGNESREQWVIWDAISRLNSGAMIHPERAAHKNIEPCKPPPKA